MSYAKRFRLNIVSQQGKLLEGEVELVVVPGEMGELGILANHTALLSTLKAGRIKVKGGNEVKHFDIGGGFIEVGRNNVMVLVRAAS